MDDPLIGLVIVDQVNGGKGLRQLSDGWSNREPKLPRLRAVVAKALVALAARLAPEPIDVPEPQAPAAPATPA